MAQNIATSSEQTNETQQQPPNQFRLLQERKDVSYMCLAAHECSLHCSRHIPIRAAI